MSKQTNKTFIAKAKEDLEVVLPKGIDGELQKKIILDDIKDKYSAGDIVGKCEVYLGDEKVGQVEIYCDRDIEKGGILDNIKYNIKNLFS